MLHYKNALCFTTRTRVLCGIPWGYPRDAKTCIGRLLTLLLFAKARSVHSEEVTQSVIDLKVKRHAFRLAYGKSLFMQ